MGKAAARTLQDLLTEYGRRSVLAGGNPYRVKAYLRAAESLAAQTEPLERLIKEDRLREIPGVGDAVADIILKLAHTGTHASLEKMRADRSRRRAGDAVDPGSACGEGDQDLPRNSASRRRKNWRRRRTKTG